MSTITTLNSTDNGTTSRTVINTNFSNLNTDKQEKGSGVTGNVPTFGASNVLGDSGVAGNKLATIDTTQSFTNKTYDTAATGNVLKINGTQVSDKTGTGKVVLDTNPTIAKPVINATNPTAQTYSPAVAGTATLDLSLSNQHYITMPAGNATIALSNDTSNQIFYVTITQDGVGSRTVTWFTTIKWAGGSAPTLTTTANKRDAFIFVRTGTGTYDGFIVGQNI